MLTKATFVKIGALAVLLSLVLAACAAPPQAASPDTPLAEASAYPDPVEGPEAQPVPPADPRPIPIADVTVQIGVGSPIPVDVIASGAWPDLCAQLAQVSQRFDGSRFEISLSASMAEPACPPDPLGIPFRLAIPLNMTNLPYGAYSVAVNGVETSFEWAVPAAEPVPVENQGLTVAYIGADGNLWIADASGGPPRQVTSDAAPIEAGGDTVSYHFPQLSSDGRYIAARRDAGTRISEGYSFQFSLHIFDSESGGFFPVIESSTNPPAGFDWKPGARLLAYAASIDPNYFTNRGGQPDADLATGISAYDLDSGASSPLVAPENGLTLTQPAWSPDGRLLGFDELIYMEGRGNFAYYDFDEKQYVHWDEPLGSYDWSPDGEQLVYDRMVYTPTGGERILTRPRLENAEQQLSPDLGQGYAQLPVFSPDGAQVAYLIVPGGPDSMAQTPVVQDLASGERRQLGTFEGIWDLQWSPDGRSLVFSAGPYYAEQVYALDVSSGKVTVLAQGEQPSLAGR